jgi:hypothetical protein
MAIRDSTPGNRLLEEAVILNEVKGLRLPFGAMS